MITKLGKQILEKQLNELQLELERTIEERSRAAAEGDLKENSAYIFMGERAEVLRSQIAELRLDLEKAQIFTAPTQTETVDYGHRIKIRFDKDKRELTITLVGKNDARLKPDWISSESPLGKALIGKHKSDRVLVNEQPVTIIEINVGDIE